MASYLIIASDIIPIEGDRMPAPEVYELMMKSRCWEFPASAPHLNLLKTGDRLVFYLGGNHARYFAGEATIDGDFQEITKSSPVTFDRKLIPFFHWRIPLTKIERFPPGVIGLDEMMGLSFAREKEVTRPYIGLLLRVGMRKLTEADLTYLRNCLKQPARG